MSIPVEHKQDGHELVGDGVVELFKIRLTSGTLIHIKNDDTLTWQGDTYEGIALQLTGVAHNSDEERSRPNLTVANPEGMFSTMIRDGNLDGAIVTRFRVLREHVLNDNNISQQQSWALTRVVSLNREKISVELRDQMDGQFFLTPARMFIPPEFPQVSLS